jgi:hypothetical protein
MAEVSDLNSELLPERVRKAVQGRIAARWYRTLVVGVVRDGKREVFPFGELEGKPTATQSTKSVQ